MLSDELSALSMHLAAHLYQGMAHLAESKIAGEDAEKVRSSLQASLSEFRAGQESARKALAQVPRLVDFLRAHWDKEYEQLLRESGFRGSLFILRDFGIHLEAIVHTVDAQVRLTEGGLRIRGTGAISPLSQLLESSTTRGMCRALIRFLDFEDQMAQTQIVNLSRFAGTR